MPHLRAALSCVIYEDARGGPDAIGNGPLLVAGGDRVLGADHQNTQTRERMGSGSRHKAASPSLPCREMTISRPSRLPSWPAIFAARYGAPQQDSNLRTRLRRPEASICCDAL